MLRILTSFGTSLTFSTCRVSPILYSGGVDTCVRRYDMERLGQSSWEGSQPSSVFVIHSVSSRSPLLRIRLHYLQNSIRSIAPHPINENLYLTARQASRIHEAGRLTFYSEDGLLYHHDIRERVPVHRLRTRSGWAGAQFHPSMEYSFIAAKDQGPDSIAMYDIRKLRRSCDTSSDNIVQQVSTNFVPARPALTFGQYASKTIGKKGTMRYDHTDITFDRTGVFSHLNTPIHNSHVPQATVSPS